jgi:hypothetical protein
VLPGLQALIKSLEPVPGRKAIALFSAGLPSSNASRLDDLALAAIAGHTVIYGFGLQGALDESPAAADPKALERLAKATGGSFVALGKNADRTIEKIVPELSACYVLGLETLPSDADGKRHAVRIDAGKSPVTLRAPAWLMARADVQDLVPAPPAPAAALLPLPGEMISVGEASRLSGMAASPASRQPVNPAREAETQQLVARAVDYVAGYEREYSALVAEENYVQSMRAERQQLRSDLLLVKPPNADTWTSFRDVFEVNGEPVRDRDDRLKRLFLDSSAAAQAQLQSIKTESARYNIGQVQRTINVPLFALQMLHPQNLFRFRFSLGNKQNVGGVEAARLEFVEQARPTLMYHDEDLPVTGWFLVDPMSGAILGSNMAVQFAKGESRAEFEVRYQRDAGLGLWVPAEMKETYQTRGQATLSVISGAGWTSTLDARATYSKFRRFQVKTEEQIKVVK